MLSDRGPWPYFLGRRETAHLELGHVVPTDNAAGFIPMCRGCNSQLGARVYNPVSAASVLRWARSKWLHPRWGRPEKKLWWLNTDVDPVTGHGVGGRLNRNPEYIRKRDARWAAARRANGTDSGR